MELSVPSILVIAFLASLTYDMGLNTLQDWSYTFYNDAFWGTARPNEALDKEEQEIDRLLNTGHFEVVPLDTDLAEIATDKPAGGAEDGAKK